MTKFKEYLMAHGAILERNSAELASEAEYIDFLSFLRDMRDRGYIDSDWELKIMRNTYEEHAKIRLAFKHMKAGLMDARTLCKLAFRYCFY